jgi:hypothetical protein
VRLIRIVRSVRRELVRKEHGQPPQHPRDEPRMAAGDAHVVPQHVEMRDTVGRVGNRRGDRDEFRATPVQTHEDLNVEVHACAQLDGVDQRAGDIKRIEAKTAHRISNRE